MIKTVLQYIYEIHAQIEWIEWYFQREMKKKSNKRRILYACVIERSERYAHLQIKLF